MPTEGFGAWTEGAGLSPLYSWTHRMLLRVLVGISAVTTTPGTECVPTWLRPLAVTGGEVSLLQPVWKCPAEQRVSPEGCGGSQWSLPLLSHLPPSCLVRTISAASFPQDSLHPRSVIPARDVHVPFPSTGVTAPVTCAQLSLGHYSLIPGSLLCRGRCSCSHQLGSWPGASLTHLHSHEKDWGKIVCKQQKKTAWAFPEGKKNRKKSMKSVQKFKERLKQQIRDIS